MRMISMRVLLLYSCDVNVIKVVSLSKTFIKTPLMGQTVFLCRNDVSWATWWGVTSGLHWIAVPHRKCRKTRFLDPVFLFVFFVRIRYIIGCEVHKEQSAQLQSKNYSLL
jgi:hypothetical protein